MGSVALHVLEVQEVLASLGHRPQLRQEGHHLVVLLWNIRVAIVAVLEQDLMNLFT